MGTPDGKVHAADLWLPPNGIPIPLRSAGLRCATCWDGMSFLSLQLFNTVPCGSGDPFHSNSDAVIQNGGLVSASECGVEPLASLFPAFLRRTS